MRQKMVAEKALAAPHPKFFGMVAGILLHPRRTFELLREAGGKAWLGMALLSMLLAILPILVAAPITARKAQELFRQQMEARPGNGQELTPDQLQQAERFTNNPLITVVFPVAASLVGLWIGWLIWSGSLYLLCTMLGGSNSFAQTWQVVVWSWLPYALRGLLQTVFILLTGSLIEHPGLSGLVGGAASAEAALAPPPGAGQLALQSILGRIDLFLFWNLALLVTGLIAAARISRRKAMTIILLVWVTLALLGLIPALIAGSFTQGFTGG
jgi:hypothetical protein